MSTAPSLAVELAPRHKFGLPLKNPVMVASGTFGYGTELRRVVDVNRLGALICTSITRTPRSGQAQPSIVETPAGLLHTAGLRNVGVHKLERSYAPVWETLEVPVILNIAARSIEEFAELAARIEGMPGVAALELNFNSVNIDPQIPFALDAGLVNRAVGAVRRQTSLPLIAKLTAGLNVLSVATAAQDGGADAISCTNSLPGMKIDIREVRRGHGTRSGGVSGPAIRPVAVRAVWEIASHVEIPVIGVGGIVTAEDALEFIMAGAVAVQVGSATYRDPAAPTKVADGIERFLAEEGIADVNELVGIAQSANESEAELE